MPAYLEEAVLLLDGCEFAVGGEVVVPVACGAQVASDLGGGDVDVVVGMPDGDPPAAVRIVCRCDAGRCDDTAGDVRPFGVVEDAVAGCGADGAVPHVLLRGPAESPGLLGA